MKFFFLRSQKNHSFTLTVIFWGCFVFYLILIVSQTIKYVLRSSIDYVSLAPPIVVERQQQPFLTEQRTRMNFSFDCIRAGDVVDDDNDDTTKYYSFSLVAHSCCSYSCCCCKEIPPVCQVKCTWQETKQPHTVKQNTYTRMTAHNWRARLTKQNKIKKEENKNKKNADTTHHQ